MSVSDSTFQQRLASVKRELDAGYTDYDLMQEALAIAENDQAVARLVYIGMRCERITTDAIVEMLKESKRRWWHLK